MRIKSQWFRGGAAKTPRQSASVMAFIAWRVTQNMLNRMRVARFDIEVGPQYFAFTREVLVFLIQVLDRMASTRMNESERSEFMTALVQRIAQILQDNEDDLMGQPTAGEPTHYDRFIDLCNQLAEHYADFDYGAQGPDFAFTRYFAHRIEAIMPRKDQPWALDQIMASEVPEALETLQRGMRGVLSTDPRPVRNSRAAATGD